jgi:hypothetical protein
MPTDTDVSTLDKLYHSGAWICLGILITFLALRAAKSRVPWLQEDHRAVWVSAFLGGLALLVVPAAQGTTPNLSMIMVALVTVFSLHADPKRTPDEQKQPQAGSARLGVMLVLAFVGAVSIAPFACTGTGPAVGTAVIDCTTAHTGEIASLLADLKAALTGGGTWGDVYQRAKAAGTEIGGCALAELVQDYLGGKAAPARGDGQTARATLERFRANEAGGATFKTSTGAL